MTTALDALAIGALVLGALALTGWTALAIRYTAPLPHLARRCAAFVFVLGIGAAFVWAPLLLTLGLLLLAFTAMLVRFLALAPATDGDWRPEVAILPYAEIGEDDVTVHRVRAFTWQDRNTFRPAYYTRTYRAADLQGTDLLVSYFRRSPRLAHTMLSWDFDGTDVLCLSIEIRREKIERWGALPGMFKQYEIVYLLGDERDFVRSRVECRGEQVHLFRLRLSPAQSWRLLIQILQHVNRLHDEPEFYGTLGRNCTTALVDHVNAVWPSRTPYFRKMVMNGYAAEQAWRRGLLRNDIPFAELHRESQIDDRVRTATDAEGFSRHIREGLPEMSEPARRLRAAPQDT